MRWFAHSLKNRPETRWETQVEHGRAVAVAARERAGKFGMAPLGEAAGSLHDLGKYVVPFQDYIRGHSGTAKGPDHSSAGAVYARSKLGHRPGRILAHIIAGHHAGLKDKVLGDDERLDRKQASFPAIVRVARGDGFDLPDTVPPDLAAAIDRKRGFAVALLTRMLFSCLVDADRTETERFTEGGTVNREFDATPADMASELHRTTAERDEALRLDGTDQDPINRLRARVRDHVASQADQPPGIFTLTVPTGGGKTLTALRFALDHAARWGLDRVLIVIPFTSVIEQSVDVYREVLPSFTDQILEHHSNFDDNRAEARQDTEEGGPTDRLRLATETWEAPLVVTTAVQFFESLFAARPSPCRKLHNVARSVIVLDEAQTMPLHLLRPCVEALKELQKSYGCSVVLCTATQPALEDRPEDKNRRPEERRSFAGGFVAPRELAPEPGSLFAALDRVAISHIGKRDDAALAARMAMSPQALCIVNSRAHARELYELLKCAGLPGVRHLSTLMLPDHRRRVLREIKDDLKHGRPCHVASTSLVEAGVDFSFPLVLRAEAGLEQIVQAAGRANRNGELGPDRKGEVLVFEADGQKSLAAMTANIETAKEIMWHHAKPQMPAAIRTYYEMLYWRHGANELDRPGVLELCKQKAKSLEFPFEEIAREMRFIDDVMKPVIVPVDDAARQALVSLGFVAKPGRLARELQRYTVGIPARALAVLLSTGAARIVREEAFGAQFVELVNLDLYKNDVGLTWDDPTFIEAGRLVM